MSRVLKMHKLAYCCAGGILIATSLPHLLPSYSRASYEVAGSSPPEELVTHVRKIADAMGLPKSDRIQVFISSGYSSLSGGSTRLPTGALLGLPRVVLFRGPNDVLQSNTLLRGQPVTWDSLEGQTLMKLLPQSTDVINFRIAHEVAHIAKHDWLWSSTLAPAMLVLGYHMTVFLCKSVFAANIHIAFPIILSLTIFAYAEMNTIVNQWLEYRADRIAASSSYKYAKGGVEFMRNCMQLDAILRDSENRNSFQIVDKIRRIFSNHPPNDRRLHRLEDILSLYGNDSQ